MPKFSFHQKISLVLFISLQACASAQDSRLWLEDIRGSRALSWVEQQNRRTLGVLEQQKNYPAILSEVRAINLAQDRVPPVTLRGSWAYNFWQDEAHPRGIWRRASLKEYLQKDPRWDIILDVDALASSERENWIYKGSNCLAPEFTRCLLTLSRGGKDASVVREFDINRKEFVPEGFFLPEAKSDSDWIDRDTLFISTDFGSHSLTDSGYPRIVKILRRGQKLSEAETVFEGTQSDVSVHASVIHFAHRDSIRVLERSTNFFYPETSLWLDNSWKRLPNPAQSEFRGVFAEQVLIFLSQDWKPGRTLFKKGSLVSFPLKSLDASKTQALYVPGKGRSLVGIQNTSHAVLLFETQDVKARLHSAHLENGVWTTLALPLPPNGTLDAMSADTGDARVLIHYENYLNPGSLWILNTKNFSLDEIKRYPRRFSAEGFVSEQYFAKSKDGMRVPYFVTNAKNMRLDAKNPTLLYGYGGFQVSLNPYYLNTIGKSFLSRGGVYVVANIRGGNEYGPEWHQAALKEKRQNAFDDFIAVAEDLVRRKITSPAHLGIEGGSNGGLLVGAVAMQRPELFSSVVCAVPLLDMLRFNKLLAGASWMDEYGNPDLPADRAYLEKYSPYQNLVAGKKYPEIFFISSTADDRVHPGHARRMAAKMESFGQPFYFYENTEGGHSAAANIEQKSRRQALSLTYTLMKLGSPQ